MHVDRHTLAHARFALREAVGTYLFDPNVNLIDFGHPEHDDHIARDELAIRIHVHEKLFGVSLETAVEAGRTQEIPPTIGGFPTDVPEGSYRLQVQETERVRPEQLWWFGPWRTAGNPRADRCDPLRGGISISSAGSGGYGTLGGVVRDRATGKQMILSNWHVLTSSWFPTHGHTIYQPGRTDNGAGAEPVATFSRDAMAHDLDAAVAVLNGRRQAINDILELGPVAGVGQAELGMEVVKSGRRTGVTRGVVTAIEGTAHIAYGRQTRVIRHVVTIEPRHPLDEISAPGDSGSWWLDAAGKKAIGLHFAGSNSPERGLAIDMMRVLDALDVDLLPGVEQQWRAAALRAWQRAGHGF
jgi:endonuclease G